MKRENKVQRGIWQQHLDKDSHFCFFVNVGVITFYHRLASSQFRGQSCQQPQIHILILHSERIKASLNFITRDFHLIQSLLIATGTAISFTSGFIIPHVDSTYRLPQPFSAPPLIHFPISLFCLKFAGTPNSLHTNTQTIFIAYATLFDFILLDFPSSFFNISTPLPPLNSELQPY